MSERPRLVIPEAGMLATTRTRRDILKLMGVGGALVLLPTMVTACDDDDDPTGNNNPPAAGSGSPLVIDFNRGDIAILQFAYALEQLEADFYIRAVQGLGSSGGTAAIRDVLADIRNHEVIHREYLKAVLTPANDFTVTATYGSLDFSNATAVLTAARDFEELGVAAYNGAAQYITQATNLLYAGKIVSVEARHASTIQDLISPKTNAFAPKSFDDAFSPAKVVTTAQNFVVNKLQPTNAPATFVQGPNNNG